MTRADTGPRERPAADGEAGIVRPEAFRGLMKRRGSSTELLDPPPIPLALRSSYAVRRGRADSA